MYKYTNNTLQQSKFLDLILACFTQFDEKIKILYHINEIFFFTRSYKRLNKNMFQIVVYFFLISTILERRKKTLL